MYEDDKRVVLTLDAGGTNFVFSAICGNCEVCRPITMPADAADLDRCLDNIVQGFEGLIERMETPPVAISFAFPGPADYKSGVICRLPNLPAFSKGDVALGPYLEEKFGLPVFINNDGALFAYGEALCGALPEINRALEAAGSARRYGNLLGITLGTGFGGGAVVHGQLLHGDNDTGGNVWVFRNKKYGDLIAEESVSIRAVARVYGQLSQTDAGELTPLDIFNIAEGKATGDRKAAIEAFHEMGEIAGDVIAQANTIVDGLIVIGGGVSGAAKYYMKPLVDEINAQIGTFGGDSFPRSQVRAYDLDRPEEMERFLAVRDSTVAIPGSERQVTYSGDKISGVITSRLGANKAISLGAYAYALNYIDNK